MLVMDFTVLMVAIPSARRVGGQRDFSHISPIFGVIFASIGKDEPRLRRGRANQFAPGHRFPMACEVIRGQAREVTLNHIRAVSSTRRASLATAVIFPMMEAISTLSG